MRIEAKDKLKPEYARRLGDCKSCPLFKRPAIVPPLRRDSRLILVGEAPGEIEEEQGDFFVGPTGRFMQRVIERHKLPWEKVHRNNALLCKADRKLSEPEWKKALACCKPRLIRDLKRIRCRVILTVGKKSMQVVTGRQHLFDWAGAPMCGERPKKVKGELVGGELHGFKVISTAHPAFALRKGKRAFLPVIAIHAQRAVMLARGKLKKWKWPTIIIEPGKAMLDALAQMAKEKRRLAIDVETFGEDPKATLLALGLGHKDLAVSMPWNEYTAGKHGDVGEIATQELGVEIAQLARKILADPAIPKTMQNGQHDILTLRAHDIAIEGYSFDTLPAHAVVAPQLPHKLGFIAGIETHAPAWKAEYHAGSDLKGAAKFARQKPSNLRSYNGRDVVMTDVLTDIAEARLEQTHKGRFFFDRYMNLCRIAITMREDGIAVSDDKRLLHREALRSRLYNARGDLRKLVEGLKMRDFNPNSNAQLAVLFFNRLRVRPTRWSKETGQPSLDEEALTLLLTDPRPLVGAISRGLLRYRRWSTLLGKYVEKLPIDRDGKVPIVHPNWKPTGALTERWSCDKPNLHNIPKPVETRLKDGTKKVLYPGLRDMYIPLPGNFMVKADYSQLELRIIALLAKDELLLRYYREKKDVHTMNAIALFGGGAEDFEPSKQERTRIKNFVYNANYGGGEETIWRLLAIDIPDLLLKDVRHMMQWWFGEHPWIVRHQKRLLKTAFKTDYAEGPFTGRRRHFYGQVEPTELYNFEVQETAAFIKNNALFKLRDAIDRKRGERILIDCHDEIVCEGPDPERLTGIMRECMETKLDYEGAEMLFTVDISTGPSWGECKE
jgi:uracil-DNA glycosylase family 4